VQNTWQKNKQLNNKNKNTNTALIEIAGINPTPSIIESFPKSFAGLPDQDSTISLIFMFVSLGHPKHSHACDTASFIKQINNRMHLGLSIAHAKMTIISWK
jgi:hypothetical protein